MPDLLCDTLTPQLQGVRLLVFDVDGVLTDGALLLDDDGRQYKAFNSKDGLGMSLLLKTGIKIAIVTARNSRVVSHRMRELGIALVVQGQHDKKTALLSLLAQLDVSPQHTAFVGDDLVDLPAMRSVALAIAVADAHPLVRQHAHWVTEAPGGKGAAREICEAMMQAQGTFEQAIAPYLV
ncbi:KdsC family phosphatase [Thiorhodospira sibirica]|uniref:KdsC family phosphatase n=1 Tax=Thiorhodospira sibirica TaxID=154347 RepID=UPI00022C119B|nr:HAD-IIIA family hydrolase [Thiorhodospira sibirica]